MFIQDLKKLLLWGAGLFTLAMMLSGVIALNQIAGEIRESSLELSGVEQKLEYIEWELENIAYKLESIDYTLTTTNR